MSQNQCSQNAPSHLLSVHSGFVVPFSTISKNRLKTSVGFCYGDVRYLLPFFVVMTGRT